MDDNEADVDCPCELNGMYFECDLACWYTVHTTGN